MKLKEAQYAKTLYEVTKDKDQKEIDIVVSGFFKLLVKNGQFNLAKKIIAKFESFWNEKKGIIEVEVITRAEMGKENLVRVEEYIKGKYEAKEVLINNKVDEKINGGIIIKVEDEILDGSVANQLKMLKNNLSK